ncbi:hypothetical protein BGX23_005299, partial [Mortierella sp. AD031]
MAHFHDSPKMGQALEQEQKRLNIFPILKVIMDVTTRWNSTLVMLRRLLELKTSMAAVHIALRTMPNESNHLKDMDNLRLSEDDWDNVHLIVDVL